MKEIYYVHKETGYRISREYLKELMIRKVEDASLTIKKLKPIFSFSQEESSYNTYIYRANNIPFNDDFETVIEDEENQFKFDELRCIDNALMCQENTDPELLEKCKRMLDIEFEKIKKGDYKFKC